MAPDLDCYKTNPDYIFRKIVDEIVLVPIRQEIAGMDSIYTMNPIGAFIWEKLETGATLAELQSAIVANYDADPETLNEDLRDFLAELVSIDAIRKV